MAARIPAKRSVPHSFKVFFDAAKAGVDDLLDSKEFFVKKFFERAELFIHVRKAHVHVCAKIAQPRIIDEDAHENAIVGTEILRIT
jgi:hypothetical protein